MQMNLFVLEPSEAKTPVAKPAKATRRKQATRVMREQILLIDRPAPGTIRQVEIKPEPADIDPMDIHEDDCERWDGLY